VQLVALHAAAAAQYSPDQEQKQPSYSCTSDQLHAMGYWKVNCLSIHDNDTKHNQEPNPTQDSPSKGKPDNSPQPMSVKELV
jgi:hypothetical protein